MVYDAKRLSIGLSVRISKFDTIDMRYSKEQLLEAIEGANSIREVLHRLGMSSRSSDYRKIRQYFLEAGVTLPEFVTTSGKPKVFPTRLTNEEYFVVGVHRNGLHTRKRLVELGIPYECSMCSLPPIWNNAELRLQVDHIDGDCLNNSLSNLRFLCPNCHTQTDTFGNKGVKKYSYCPCGAKLDLHLTTCTNCDPPIRNVCKDCGGPASRRAVRCRTCSNRMPSAPQHDWPPVEEVVRMVNESSFSAAARIIGSSDNGVRKFLRRNGVDISQKPLIL